MDEIWELYEAKMIMEGSEDVKAGRFLDAKTAILKLKEKYCLSSACSGNEESHACQGKTLDKAGNVV